MSAGPKKRRRDPSARRFRRIALASAAVGFGLVAAALGPQGIAQAPHPMSREQMHSMPLEDSRELVAFPEALRVKELANMRDHLATLSRIQEYLSQHEFDKAANLAEQRLGMSSFGLHGAHEVALYMPKGMQEAGTAMHRAASRFAIASQEAAVDNDVGRAIGALSEVSQACVACHAAYRLK